MTGTTDLLLGAYSMAPQDPAESTRFYDRVAELDIAGLQFPLLDDDAPTMSREWQSRHLLAEWSLLLTCIPTTTARLTTDPGYGIAADDDDARRRALDDIARAARLARDLADSTGRSQVAAIELHSAPGPRGGDVDALARSLEEIGGWDLAGARLLLEHCDAHVPGQPGAKEFLTLDAEIAAVLAAGGPDNVQISINWGRSAIEARGAHGPVDHVREASRHGLLGAVVFSGATGAATPWGPPWSDAHIPPHGPAAALARSAASLLGRTEMAETLAVATGDPLVAVKIGVRPADLPVPDRVAVALAALDEVAAAQADATAGLRDNLPLR